MPSSTSTRWLCAAALLAVPLASRAFDGVTDTTGDFLSTFGGSTSSTDLDVVGATALYDPAKNLFQLSATMAGNIGLTPTGFYVWGVNRGGGTAGFAANGIAGVRFDSTVILRPGGASTAGGAALAPSAVTVSGRTITALFSGDLLASNGFGNKLDYTWNLWPRDSRFAGFAAISDFAPDNANFSSTSATLVPEPQALALMLGGLGALGVVLARRRATADGR